MFGYGYGFGKQRGGGSALLPEKIAGTLAYWDAKRSPVTHSSGSFVSQWNDLSANNNHATQPEASKQLTKVNDRLITGTATNMIVPEVKPRTIIVLCRNTGGASVLTAILSSNNALATCPVIKTRSNSGAGVGNFGLLCTPSFGVGQNPKSLGSAQATAPADDTDHIASFLYTASPNSRIRLNEQNVELVANRTGSSDEMIIDRLFDSTNVGSHAYRFQGQVMAIYLNSNILDIATVEKIETYLLKLHGVSI